MEEVASVYGPAGVRAHILDTVTPYLNERTAHYLGALSDGNITAIWTTLTKTAKGELREKFTIDVVNSLGAKIFAGALRWGEAQGSPGDRARPAGPGRKPRQQAHRVVHRRRDRPRPRPGWP